MTPLTRKFLDAAIAVALTFGIVLVIVVTSTFLTSRGGYAQGFKMWLSLMERSDIIGMAVLTSLVSTGYSIWQGGGRR